MIRPHEYEHCTMDICKKRRGMTVAYRLYNHTRRWPRMRLPRRWNEASFRLTCSSMIFTCNRCRKRARCGSRLILWVYAFHGCEKGNFRATFRHSSRGARWSMSDIRPRAKDLVNSSKPCLHARIYRTSMSERVST